jgi:hypothetical protein
MDKKHNVPEDGKLNVVCDLCGERFAFFSRLWTHRKRKHPDREGVKPDLTCQFCGLECGRLDSLARHKRNCKENPNVKRRTRKEKARPTLLQLVAESHPFDAGNNDVVDTPHTPFNAAELPRIDIVQNASLGTFGEDSLIQP